MSHFSEVEGLPISLISERTRFVHPAGPVNANIKAQEKKTGTTTVGLVGKDFVLLAADQQATMGNMAADDDAAKVYKITNRVGLTISGAVGDSLAVIRFLKAQANLYEIERGIKITPRAITTLLSNVLNNNRYYPYIFMPIVGGINKQPQLYELTPFGCISKKKKYAVTGSGTELAIGILDSDYKEGMTQDESIQLAVKAIMVSKNRDIYTGGRGISMVIITKNDYKKIDEKEVEKVVSKIKLNFSKIGK